MGIWLGSLNKLIQHPGKSPMTNPMLEQFSGSSTIMIDLGDETAEVGEGATLDEEDNEQDVLQRNWHIELINSQVASPWPCR